jgi:hypothetical protein
MAELPKVIAFAHSVVCFFRRLVREEKSLTWRCMMKNISSYRLLSRTRWATLLLTGLLLFFSLGSALAQSMHWSPESMNFPDVPYGTTETQTLTLTNADLALPLNINSIEWTFMMYYDPLGESLPAFSFAADRLVPSTLLPGESMTIDITFSPIDDGIMSFVSAEMRITNTSGNDPSLNFFVVGLGVNDDLCAPMTTCDGLCKDLSSDAQNCGLCDNACSAPANAMANCQAGICGFICDAGYEPVGDGCQLIVEQTLEEMMDNLLAFADQSVENGTLLGLGPGASGPAKRDAFIHHLALAQEWISFGTPETLEAACGSLNFNQLRCDGGWPFIMPPDFVAGEAASEIYNRILAIMDLIEGCERTEAPARPQQ